MKRVMLLSVGICLILSSCTLFSKRKRQLAAHEEAGENNWIEKEHHYYKGASSQNDR